MQNRYQRARDERGLTLTEVADRMQVDKSTIKNWESGRRQPSLDKLIQLSNILDFGVEYLIGIESEQVAWTKPINKDVLPVLHSCPVWTPKHGWALVNNVLKVLVFANGESIELETVQEPIYAFPPAFTLSFHSIEEPLGMDNILQRERVWVEPITCDTKMSMELRGWYHPYDRRLVQNEFGNRFYLDTYGAKWLAFEDCLVPVAAW